MIRLVSVIVASTLMVSSAFASEYCEGVFYQDVTRANAELGGIFEWQKTRQQEAQNLISHRDALDKAISNAINAKNVSPQQKIDLITPLQASKEEAQNKIDQIATEQNAKLARIKELRGSVPEDLKKKAEDCAKEVAPANLVVNLVVQGLAVYYTAGLSLLLPPKTLYIDMGEVMHGNIMGGEHSAPNEVKNWFNARTGLHL